MVSHAGQNAVDRAIGEAWEQSFGQMVGMLGMECHRPEPPEIWWPDKGLLPDRVVEYGETTEWHELKHKRPTRGGEYGLEGYRAGALHRLAKHTGQPVLYTIHDWEAAGARTREEETENNIADWFTVDVLELDEGAARAQRGRSYYNSGPVETTIYYWPTDMWEPLAWRWGIDAESKARSREKREMRDVLWAIVKDSKGLNETGHGRAVRWARASLGLDE